MCVFILKRVKNNVFLNRLSFLVTAAWPAASLKHVILTINFWFTIKGQSVDKRKKLVPLKTCSFPVCASY